MRNTGRHCKSKVSLRCGKRSGLVNAALKPKSLKRSGLSRNQKKAEIAEDAEGAEENGQKIKVKVKDLCHR
jgi:hypothetical protein